MVQIRTYADLTKEEKAEAISICVDSLLSTILQGLGFADELNRDNLQARIDAAIQKAEDMFTPWYAADYIMDTCKEDITDMATCDAEDALYPDENKRCIVLGS